jgi:hypothetical protein
VDASGNQEAAELEVEVAQDTIGDLRDRADRVRWPTGARGDAGDVADAWQAVADADPGDLAAVQEANGRYVELDEEFQDEYCDGGVTADDLGG